jgi:hypothetical protein
MARRGRKGSRGEGGFGPEVGFSQLGRSVRLCWIGNSRMMALFFVVTSIVGVLCKLMFSVCKV